jgi:hypothetical protein
MARTNEGPRPHLPAHINTFYLLWFTWFDPIVLFFTVLSCVFDPAGSFDMLVPSSVSPYEPLQAPLMYQIASFVGFMGIIFAVLLRASPDPTVWRIVQGATLAVDLSLIAVMAKALEMQGKLGKWGEWRGMEKFNMLFTVAIALGRMAFLMRVGERKVLVRRSEMKVEAAKNS